MISDMLDRRDREMKHLEDQILNNDHSNAALLGKALERADVL
jgi:hypothetical protein